MWIMCQKLLFWYLGNKSFDIIESLSVRIKDELMDTFSLIFCTYNNWLKIFKTLV